MLLSPSIHSNLDRVSTLASVDSDPERILIFLFMDLDPSNHLDQDIVCQGWLLKKRRKKMQGTQLES